MPIPLKDKKEFERRFNIELNKSKTLPNKSINDVLQILRQYRLEVVDVISAAPTEWSVYHGQQIRGEIDRLTNNLESLLYERMSTGLDDAWAAGLNAIDNTIAGIQTINPVAIGFSLEDLMISKDLASSLVTDVANSTREQIGREVMYHIMGKKANGNRLTPQDTIKSIGQLIIDDTARKGAPSSVFKSVADRASFILRTETGRVQNAALYAKTETLADEEDGVRKYWIASFSGRRDHRDTHQSLDRRTNPKNGGTPIPYKSLFTLSSGQKARFPHDPRLNAKETVNCLCRLGTTLMTDDELKEYYN